MNKAEEAFRKLLKGYHPSKEEIIDCDNFIIKIIPKVK
jgi:hypothetical protein